MAVCQSCHIEKEFFFDITKLASRWEYMGEDFARAWTPLGYGNLYAEWKQDWDKRGLSSLDANADSLSSDEFESQLKQLLDDGVGHIAGRYKVLGRRAGTMGVAYLCGDQEWSPTALRPYFVVCKMLALSPDRIAADVIKKEVEV
jgi:hypothetical protein